MEQLPLCKCCSPCGCSGARTVLLTRSPGTWTCFFFLFSPLCRHFYPSFLLLLRLSFFVSAPLCEAMSLSLTFSFPPDFFFLGYQTIFPAVRPLPLSPSIPASSSSSCGSAPIRGMITLRHSVMWRGGMRAAAAHTAVYCLHHCCSRDPICLLLHLSHPPSFPSSCLSLETLMCVTSFRSSDLAHRAPASPSSRLPVVRRTSRSLFDPVVGGFPHGSASA